jgi:hypothetical protein
MLGSKPTFMTMGNHECAEMRICTTGGGGNNNFTAFMNALSQAQIATEPYYTVDVNTGAGLARFVFIADNAWDQTQSGWLEQTLSDADANAKYTFVMRHHPIANNDLQQFVDINTIIQKHKYALFFTGHTHEFKHTIADDPQNLGRVMVMGIGGAQPFDGLGSYFGYGTVEQLLNGNLVIRVYDVSSGNQMVTFTVGPNK